MAKKTEDKKSPTTSMVGSRSSIFGTSMDNVCVVSNNTSGPYFKITIQPAVKTSDMRLITNDRNSATALNGIVTDVSVEQASRTEWAHTLGNQVFAYTFGEALYDISVQGIGFVSCTKGSKDKADPLTPLLKFYTDNNIAKEGKYCTVILGDTTYKAYLIAGNVAASLSSGLSVWPFNFKFKAIRSNT